MPPVHGEDFELHVAAKATPTAFEPIGDMNSYRRGSTRSETTTTVFMRSEPYVTPGRRTQTIELGGFLNITDAGQEILRAAEADGTTVILKVMWNPTDGFTQECSVREFSNEADPEALLPHGFALTPVAAAAIVGAGPIV